MENNENQTTYRELELAYQLKKAIELLEWVAITSNDPYTRKQVALRLKDIKEENILKG